MGGACRLGDRAKVPLDVHGCPACPHPDAQGPSVTASGNVSINGAPALRAGDIGIHATCCATNMWKVTKGSGQVIINGQAMVRKGDPTQHCGGVGKMIEASGNVVDGSGDAESLLPQIEEWLERVQENGIAELLHMVAPGLGAAYFGAGELGKLASPECRGLEYFKHLAKCLPSKPPGDSGEPPRSQPNRYRGPPDLPVEPVGLLDPTNPITDIVMLPFTAVRGGEVAVETVPRAGKWAIKGVGDAVKGIGDAGHFVGGLAGIG